MLLSPSASPSSIEPTAFDSAAGADAVGGVSAADSPPLPHAATPKNKPAKPSQRASFGGRARRVDGRSTRVRSFMLGGPHIAQRGMAGVSILRGVVGESM